MPGRATAGSYQLADGYPQGSGTLAVSGSSTVNLTDPNFNEELPYSPGTVTYSYTEDFRWEWVPAEGMTLEEDPPQEVHIGLVAAVTLDLSASSSVYGQYCSGSGSFSFPGDSTSISGSGGPSPTPWTQSGVGSTDMVKEIVLNAATVDFEAEYSGTITVSNGVAGYIGLYRDLGGVFITIQSASGPRPGGMAQTGTISISGAWSTVPKYKTTVNDYKIQFFNRIPPTAFWGNALTNEAGPPLGFGGNWAKSGLVVAYDSTHPTHVMAKLWGKLLGSSVLTACNPAGLCEAWTAVNRY